MNRVNRLLLVREKRFDARRRTFAASAAHGALQTRWIIRRRATHWEFLDDFPTVTREQAAAALEQGKDTLLAVRIPMRLDFAAPADDGAALHFVGPALVEAVSSSPEAARSRRGSESEPTGLVGCRRRETVDMDVRRLARS
jgi:hypothetical protein